MPDIIQVTTGEEVTIVFGGVKGDPGNATVVAWTAVHEQAVANAQWTINHNLNGYPSVTTVDTNGIEIKGNVSFVNVNQVLVQFNRPIAGRAFLS